LAERPQLVPKRVGGSAAKDIPTTGSVGCWPRAAIGQATAPPLRSVMNWRRFKIASPPEH
jgi:hypothetical protein